MPGFSHRPRPIVLTTLPIATYPSAFLSCLLFIVKEASSIRIPLSTRKNCSRMSCVPHLCHPYTDRQTELRFIYSLILPIWIFLV